MVHRLTLILLVVLAAALTLDDLVVPFYSGTPQPIDENMQDTGWMLTITRELLKGRMLYEQVFTPYGPIPHSVYEAMAWAFGNTALTYAGYVALLSAVVLALEFILVRRYLSLPLALGFYILVLSHFTRISIIYANCEAIAILLLALFWRPIAERTSVRCILYGVILAFLHFSKFGSDMVAAAALVLLDVIQWFRSPQKAQLLRSALGRGLIVGVAFLVIVAMGTFPLIECLSPMVAKDVLLPFYLKTGYNFVKPEYRYPYYLGILFFTKFHLPMLLGLVACLSSLAALLVGRNFMQRTHGSPDEREDAFPYPLLIPPLYFIFASFVFLKSAWHFNQYGIYAAFGTSLALCAFGPAVRKATLILLLPYLLVAFVAWVKVPLGIRPAPVVEYLNTPSGEILAGPPDLVRFYQKTFSAIDEEIAFSGTTSNIAVLTDRPGIYVFSGHGVVGRIPWYFPGWLRPWEENAAERAFAQAGAILVGVPARIPLAEHPEPQEIARSLGTLFSPQMTAFVEQRLTHPIFIGVDPSANHVAVWAFALASRDTPSAEDPPAPEKNAQRNSPEYDKTGMTRLPLAQNQ